MAVNKKIFTFVWKIENFSMLPHQNGEPLASPTFVVDTWKETEWVLALYPRGKYVLESGDHVSVYFEKITAGTEIPVNFAIALESTESSEVIKIFDSQIVNIGFGYKKFISLIDLYNKKNYFLPNDILTLRFELSPADGNSTDKKVINELISPQHFVTRSCISRSSILIHRRSIMWPIKNINKRGEQQRYSIQLTSVMKKSPNFEISCNLSEISSNDYLSIKIRQTSLSRSKGQLFVKCKMTVVGAHKECQDSAESTHLFKLELGDVFCFPPFIKTSILTSHKYLYLKDTLLLQCDFAFSYKSDIYQSEFNCIPLAFNTKTLCGQTDFVHRIQDFYMQGKFCDVFLQAGDQTFPAYKMLLCARSSVFTAMFELDMKEKNSNVVNITDVEPTILKKMLDFIHADAIGELSHEDACNLYQAANKYNVDCLKLICSISLISAMSVANACEILSLADLYDDHFLMNAVHTFISTNSNNIFHSTHWENFMNDNPKLSMQIMHQCLKEQHF